ncbi:kinase-like domain-containing protein [Tirmania nivea]|nr:kinase-like domain-containing protein [Tirmania nivea]
MALSQNNSDLHGPGRGGRPDGRSDPGQEETWHGESEAGLRTEIEVKRSSGASIWSPPHLFHRHSQSQHQEPHGHQHHHLRMHLNPLQYVHQESRPRSMSDSRQHLSISTTAPPSPANGVSNSSPISRSSSKASSPTTFYENANYSTLYHPPHLHFTHQQPVKETHRLDLDFDPISGRKSINKYEIIDEIGRGTHGKVKLGRDLTSDEYVAIKIVERHSRPRLGKMIRQDDEKVRREIAILKKCRHPNVVRLIEVIDDPASKKVYLVLEYVELGEIVWRKFGPRDLLRRERNRLKRELTGENEEEEEEEEEEGGEEDSEGERIRRRKRRRRKQLKEGRLSTGTSNLSDQINHENPNFWSLELGGLTEEDDEATDDDYPSVGEDERYEPSIVDAPHISPLDSDTEEPSHHICSLSMVALGPNSDLAYSFSHEDLQYVPALTFEQARSTFRDTVLGLEYLHYHGIIHRDIKPANLLWTKDYRVKISDFGVSYFGRGVGEEEDEEGSGRKKDKFSGRDEEIELVKTVGTPAFFAPELCFFDTSKPRPQITSAIDVWALGVTLYCLIFARCPFLADGEFELFNVIAKQELFIPKRRLRPGQGYSASVKSLSRPTSSNRPLSLHHQRTHSGKSAKTAPIYPRPTSGSRGKGAFDDHETEIIPDDLRDLLKKLLTKDPTERITIKEVKRH